MVYDPIIYDGYRRIYYGVDINRGDQHMFVYGLYISVVISVTVPNANFMQNFPGSPPMHGANPRFVVEQIAELHENQESCMLQATMINTIARTNPGLFSMFGDENVSVERVNGARCVALEPKIRPIR